MVITQLNRLFLPNNDTVCKVYYLNSVCGVCCLLCDVVCGVWCGGSVSGVIKVLRLQLSWMQRITPTLCTILVHVGEIGTKLNNPRS